METSVIIPVYNAESYISLLLKDLHNQDEKSVEFLLINDGSNDRTAIMIKNYIAKCNDKRFVLINKQNGGVSDARNVGLDNAKGKYVIFVDSDDRLSKRFVSSYVYAIKHNGSDIEIFSAYKVLNNKNPKIIGKIDYEPVANANLISVKQYIKYFSNLQAWGYPFCYIFKRELWRGIRFDTDIAYQEDVLAFFKVITRKWQLKIHINKESYYYYVLRQSSALHSMSVINAWEFVIVDDRLLRMVNNNENLKDVYSYLLALKLSSLMIVIAFSCLESNDEYFNRARKQFLQIMPKAKYISKKIEFRRILQYILILMKQRKLIKIVYRKLNKEPELSN